MIEDADMVRAERDALDKVLRERDRAAGHMSDDDAAKELAALEAEIVAHERGMAAGRKHAMTDDFTLRVLKVMSGELCQDLSWTFQGDQIRFWVDCSDTFWWGTADAEEVTAETLPELEQAVADTRGAREFYLAAELYAARRRKMRPQGCAYPRDEKLRVLFDACGPEREVGLGNPYERGQYPTIRPAT